MLTVKTDELAKWDYSKYKKPEILEPYRHECTCSISKCNCENKAWICDNFTQRDWNELGELHPDQISRLINNKNFNNVSEELQNMLIGDD
jgi:hypothetical protein